MSQCQGHHGEGKTEDLSLEETMETQGQDAQGIGEQRTSGDKLVKCA